VCAYHCVQQSYTTHHRTVLIILPLVLQTIIIEGGHAAIWDKNAFITRSLIFKLSTHEQSLLVWLPVCQRVQFKLCCIMQQACIFTQRSTLSAWNSAPEDLQATVDPAEFRKRKTLQSFFYHATTSDVYAFIDFCIRRLNHGQKTFPHALHSNMNIK